jgi:thiamine biosynthesis lipoprotein
MTSADPSRGPQRRVEHCMGTVFSIDARSPGVIPADVDAVVEWLHWVDGIFSTYKPSSQVQRLARLEMTLDDAAPEVREVLERCSGLKSETAGFFSACAGGTLDPSGFVKGWAIQRASEILSARGSVNHCVNGGGDVQCAGSAGPGEPWRIGIAHPKHRERLAGIIVGNDLAIATSGTSERGDHIVRPVGRGGDDLASISVVGRELSSVDAFATAAFAMGTQAREWIESKDGYQALIVYADGTIWSSPALVVGEARRASNHRT